MMNNTVTREITFFHYPVLFVYVIPGRIPVSLCEFFFFLFYAETLEIRHLQWCSREISQRIDTPARYSYPRPQNLRDLFTDWRSCWADRRLVFYFFPKFLFFGLGGGRATSVCVEKG